MVSPTESLGETVFIKVTSPSSFPPRLRFTRTPHKSSTVFHIGEKTLQIGPSPSLYPVIHLLLYFNSLTYLKILPFELGQIYDKIRGCSRSNLYVLSPY